MPITKLLCWNVNGIRAIYKHGFLNWVNREYPDILCLQETKATPDDLSLDLRLHPGYVDFWNYPVKKGYAGVATFSRQEPLEIRTSFENTKFDPEGRVLITKHKGFILYNVYFPNGKKNAERLKYKMDFYDVAFEDMEKHRLKGEKLIICGDYNTAHNEIDIARPKENSKISGFLPMERAWLDTLETRGYIDIFRHFNSEPGQYTFWDVKTGARERNIGWRIDYYFITPNLLSKVTGAEILKDVTGSDHCPISLILKTE